MNNVQFKIDMILKRIEYEYYFIHTNRKHIKRGLWRVARAVCLTIVSAVWASYYPGILYGISVGWIVTGFNLCISYWFIESIYDTYKSIKDGREKINNFRSQIEGIVKATSYDLPTAEDLDNAFQDIGDMITSIDNHEISSHADLDDLKERIRKVIHIIEMCPIAQTSMKDDAWNQLANFRTETCKD